MRTGLAAVVALLLAAGCGAAGPIAVSPAPSLPGAAQLGDADDGRNVTFHVGDTISVVLHQQQGLEPWSALDSSNHAVLAPRVDTRNAAAKGVTLGLFSAVASGSAQITANAGMDCSPGFACPAMVRVWTVTVTVA